MKRPFVFILSGNAAGAAFGFLLSAVLGRLLDVSSFGRLNFILSTSLILAALFDGGFCNTLVVMHNRLKNDASGAGTIQAIHREYLRLFPFLLLAGLCAVALVAGSYSLGPGEAGMLLVLSLAAAVYRYANSVNQATGNWRVYSLLQMAGNLAKLLIVPAAVVLISWLARRPLYEAALAGFALQAVALVLLALCCGNGSLRLGRFGDAAVRRRFYATLVPLGLILLVSTAGMRLDVLLVKKFVGDAGMGIYAGAVILVQVFPLVTGSLMDSLLGTSSEQGHGLLGRIDSYQRRYFLPMLCCFVLLQLLAGPLITVCLGARYAGSIPVFRVLLFPYFWGMLFTPLESYFMANHSREILYLHLVQIAVIAAVSILLIPHLQLLAVAFSIALSRVLRWGYFYARRCQILRSLEPVAGEAP